VDLAIEGCLLARRRLVISGQPASPELQRRLEAIVARAEARDPALRGLVSFLGRTTDAQLRDLLGRCAALVFPPREDFGIAPVEAMAAGVPVIAYRAGGALDYLQDGVGGVFFDAQEPASLAAALARFDPAAFDPAQVASALPDLSVARFLREMRRHAGIAEAAP
jgi:glycosyltransferase involved in cell wall biosynthesis